MIRLIAMLLMLIGTPALAQGDDCDDYLPCGPIPWQLPQPRGLASPTPFPTSQIVVTTVPTSTPGAAPTNTSVPTATPITTATPALNLTNVQDSILTMQAAINATQPPLLDYSGNPAPGQITGSTSTLWGYVKGMAAINFGVFSPLMAFVLFMLLWVVGYKLLLIIAPAITVLFGFLRKIVQLVLDFIPG